MIRLVDASGTPRKWGNVRLVNSSSALHSIKRIRLVTAAGVNTIYDGDGAGSLTLYASPSSAGGGSKTNIVTTVPVGIGVSGGTAPYTYAWSLSSLSGAGAATALSPTSSTTQFRATSVSPDGAEADFVCTVTDAAGLTNTIDVPATFSRF